MPCDNKSNWVKKVAEGAEFLNTVKKLAQLRLLCSNLLLEFLQAQ
jgi:hypothetical protein